MSTISAVSARVRPADPVLPIEPEYHFIGQLVSATIPSTYSNAFANYHITAGADWTLVNGQTVGQTQCDYPSPVAFLFSAETPMTTAYFAHPIDLHYYTRAINQSPRMTVTVGTLSAYNQSSVIAYGMCHIPMECGRHVMRIPLWRPLTDWNGELRSFYCHESTELTDTDIVAIQSRVHQSRQHLYTLGAGTCTVEWNVVTRNTHLHHIDT